MPAASQYGMRRRRGGVRRRLRLGSHGLHEAAFEHVGRRGFGSGVGQLADEPARFRDGFCALRAAGGQMSFERGAFRRVERAKRVGFVHLPELVAVAHVAACNASLKRINPLRIQLLTVPSGSFSSAAISVWLKP